MRMADFNTDNAAYNHYSKFNSFSTKIENLCLLFFILRKDRLHFIHLVGSLVSRLVSPLISFSKCFPPYSSPFFFSSTKEINFSFFKSLNDDTKILTKTNTNTFYFCPRPNFPKLKLRLFFRDQIF